MSTTTPTPSWLRATKTLVGAHLRLAAWFWGIMIALLVGGHVLMGTVIGTRVLIANYGSHGATWFVFSLGVIFTFAFLPVHITSGLTRRSFIRANILTALTIGLVYGVGLFLLVLLEQLVFPAASLPYDTDPVIGVGSSVPWGVLIGQTLLSTTAILCGLLVAIAYYRTNPLVGTVLLIPTVGPVLVMVALTAGDAPLQQWLGLPTSTGLAVLAAGLVIAAAATAFHLVTRHVPINPVEQS